MRRRSVLGNRSGIAALVAALMLLSAACGSDDSAVTSAPATGDATGGDAATATTAPAADDGGSESSDQGGGTATMTMADGTVYDFALTVCDTSATDPVGLPLTNGYDVFGFTGDGAFSLYLGRGGFTDEQTFAAGTLEGDFDENGKNAGILYNASNESLDLLIVDGSKLTGELAFRAIGPPGPHGEETVGTLALEC